jgi:hypothetical protein
MANLQDHLQQTAATGQPSDPLFRLFEALYRQPYQVFSFQVPYSIPVLVICALAATAALTWLLKQPLRAPAALDTSEADPTDQLKFKHGTNRAKTDLARLAAAGLGTLTSETRDATS